MTRTFLAAVLVLAACRSATKSIDIEPLPATVHPPATVPPGDASIGSARMKPDGTIILMLRGDSGKGTIGDALITYSPSDPDYERVRKHIGAIKPGQSKPVPPWPEGK